MIAAATLAFVWTIGADPAPEPLWPQGAQGAITTSINGAAPSITIYRPPADLANGTACVICPGGGYSGLALGHEGRDVAQWLNDRGVLAAVLQYRVRPKTPNAAHLGDLPLRDAQEAIANLRRRCGKDLTINPARIGIWGFSAGGHLASTAATHFSDANRPDFAILAYPVITMEGNVTHAGSRRNLLGDKPTPEDLRLYSSEHHVSAKTPPCFVFHTSEDSGVLPENSLRFYAALRKAGVPSELHIYEKGKHGLGLAGNVSGTSDWPNRLETWMRLRGLLGSKPAPGTSNK